MLSIKEVRKTGIVGLDLIGEGRFELLSVAMSLFLQLGIKILFPAPALEKGPNKNLHT